LTLPTIVAKDIEIRETFTARGAIVGFWPESKDLPATPDFFSPKFQSPLSFHCVFSAKVRDGL
jgi:hypothetical protein